MLSVRCRILESSLDSKRTTIYLDGEPICHAITDTFATKTDAEELEKYLSAVISRRKKNDC